MMDNISLSLFFTGGVSLQTWDQTGLLNRELAIYRHLRLQDIQTRLITYGHPIDKKYSKIVSPLKIITTPWFPNSLKTSRRLMLKHFPSLYCSDVLKTNQILGSDVAVKIKKIFKKPLITRCGYLHSFFTQEHFQDRQVIDSAINLEAKAFQVADESVVTTYSQREYVIRNYSLDPEKVHVIPNYVDTNLFTPNPKIQKKWDLIFVGRSDSQKNLVNLLDAIFLLSEQGIRLNLLLIGGSGQDPVLTDYIKKYNLPVTQISNVPNEKLPAYLNASRAFILPSLYEGHPKALLEAMSCGLSCIGTPVPGIQEEIIHESNGYLTSDTASLSLSTAIQSVLDDNPLLKKTGQNAREYILSHYSLDYVSDQESQLIKNVVNNW